MPPLTWKDRSRLKGFISPAFDRRNSSLTVYSCFNLILMGNDSDAGVSILRYIGISIPIKYSNFSRFYKKLGPFYKKLRCDKFGNWLISTKNALNNQIQSSMKIYMYIVWNCCLPIADFYMERITFVKTSLLPSKNDEFHENAHFL